MLKKVSKLGKNTAKVNTVCTSFHPSWMPGSVNWWWKPVGVEKSTNSTNATRAIGSLNSLPPACFGTITYHEMYAGSSQK